MRYEKTVKLHLRQIFQDHWTAWWEKYRERVPEDMQKSVSEAVEKMLGCGDPKNGFIKYRCVACEEHPERVQGFSCKSRFCPRCGKRYVDEWVEKQVQTIVNVSHRHTVFTIPEELRAKVYWHRKMLDATCDRVAAVIRGWYSGKHRKKGKRTGRKEKGGDEVGVIAVVHTFGRDMKFNPHIHALVTEGALTPGGRWKPVEYIPYAYLRKAWQKLLMDLVLERFGHETKMRNLVNQLYHRYKDGFYVPAETRMKDAQGAARYIGRYLARPVIAEYRKHSRMVHRYGLYRRNKGKLAKSLGGLLPKRQLTLFATNRLDRKTWRERMTESFGEDPLKRPRCGAEMVLWEVWHPEKGFLYHVFHEESTPIGRRFGQHAHKRMGRRRDSVPRQQAGRVA